MSLEEHYNNYLNAGNTTCTVTSCGDYTSGFTCSYCGKWVWMGCDHSCYPVQYYYPLSQNKTELSYKILKSLVEKKVIPEPRDYQEFCKILETIRDVV